MKKYLLILVMLLSLFVFVSCDDDPNNPPGGGGSGDFWDADGNGIPDWQEEEITLTFATWQYTNMDMVTIDTKMADAFMAKYPNITIEFVNVGEEYDWDTNLYGLLESGDLPDVFLVRRMETLLPYNILADLTDMYNNDEDTECIFPAFQNSGVFEGKRYAIPTYVYPQFWIVNKTLLAEKNVAIPTYDWTFDQMMAIAQKVSDSTKNYIGLYGRQGYYGEGCDRIFFNEYPKVLKLAEDKEVGSTWVGWGYDGTRFNFDDPVFLQSMTTYAEALTEGWAKRGLTAEEKSTIYHDEEYVPTTSGKVGVWVEASWSWKDQMDLAEFEWDIYPGPSGVTGGNTDIAGVSYTCKHKQAAYQFLKWMSYSEEGILSRFEIYEESTANPESALYQQGNNYPYPIVDYGIDEYGVNKIWSSIPYGSTAPGLVSSEFIEALKNGAYTMNKEVVGWDAVDYAINNKDNGYFKDIYSGASTFAALRQSIQEAADKAMAQQVEAVKAALSGF